MLLTPPLWFALLPYRRLPTAPGTPAVCASSRSEKRAERSSQSIRIPRLAFPDDASLPSKRCEPLHRALVPGHVARALCFPEVCVCARPNRPESAGMAMPEAAMNEDHLATLREHEVRMAWKVGSMQSISIPHPVHQPSNDHLWHRVLAADARHVVVALCRREHIAHLRQPRTLLERSR